MSAGTGSPVGKVSYVIKSGAGWYLSVEGAPKSSKNLKDAKRFSSATEALSALVFGKASDDNIPWTPNLVKVVETEGTGEVRRALKETEAAGPGERVKYAIYGVYARKYWAAGENEWQEVKDALLFDSQTSALEFVQDFSEEHGYSLGGIEIRRIVVTPNEPKVTQTVLS